MGQLKAETKYSMNDYLKHLFNDIDQVISNAGDYFKKFDLEDSAEHRYVPMYKCEGTFKMSSIFSISIDALPEEDKLDDEQILHLAHKLEELWNTYHFFADFPTRIDAREKYTLMRDKWNEDVKLASRGETHIEFCHHGPGDCQFEGRCTICNDLQDD